MTKRLTLKVDNYINIPQFRTIFDIPLTAPLIRVYKNLMNHAEKESLPHYTIKMEVRP